MITEMTPTYVKKKPMVFSVTPNFRARKSASVVVIAWNAPIVMA